MVFHLFQFSIYFCPLLKVLVKVQIQKAPPGLINSLVNSFQTVSVATDFFSCHQRVDSCILIYQLWFCLSSNINFRRIWSLNILLFKVFSKNKLRVWFQIEIWWEIMLPLVPYLVGIRASCCAFYYSLN